MKQRLFAESKALGARFIRVDVELSSESCRTEVPLEAIDGKPAAQTRDQQLHAGQTVGD